MNYMNFILCTLCLTLVACGGDSESAPEEEKKQETHTLEIEVLPFKVPCTAVDEMLCLQVSFEGDEEAPNFYGSIQGFDYQWGHHYSVLAERVPVEDPPADGASYVFELREVLSETEDDVGTVYSFERVELASQTFTESEGQYFMLGKSFECGDNVNCDELVELNNTGGMVNVMFAYTGEGNIRLINWE